LRLPELDTGPGRVIALPAPAGLWPRGLLRTILTIILPAVLVALCIVMFVAQPTQVIGVSMEPTLVSGQRLVVDKLSYRFQQPARGDLVVLNLPDAKRRPLIKRVVATGGDVVAIEDGLVFLNGQPLVEDYISQLTSGYLPATRVPEGYLFVLGDNRAASNDSRSFGMVPFENLAGRAVASYWPPATIGSIEQVMCSRC
jgi:signal peptidase I